MLKQQLNLTVAIVRTYGYPDIGKFVQKLLDLGIGHVVVVVPYKQDCGVTGPVIEAMDNPGQIHLLRQDFKHGGRSWSAMLNAGLDYIDDNAIPHEFVLMVSNTVVLEKCHLEQLYVEMECPTAMAAGAKFRGVGKNGEEVSLGAAYNNHCRNTLALYRAQAFQLLGPALRRFDESFDGAGGMEDLAWKLMLLGLTAGFWVVAAPVVVPLLVHAHRTPQQQAQYEADMEAGIKVAQERVKNLIQ